MQLKSAVLELSVVVCLATAGQLALKIGVEGGLTPSSVSDYAHFFTNGYFFGGCVLYLGSFFLYVHAISYTPLSLAYPFIGLSYVLVVFGESVLYQRPMTVTKLVGVSLIFAGVALLGLGISE